MLPPTPKLAGAVLGTCATLYILSSAFSSRRSSQSTLGVVHIVLFKFSESMSAADKDAVSINFVRLKDSCRLPDGSHYVQSIDGGLNNSPEGSEKGFEHAYVMTFASSGDRDYYVHSDPAHAAFKETLAGRVADVLVFDYTAADFLRPRLSKHVS